MVKVSIIPTLSILIIVTLLRIDHHTVKANIGNPSKIKSAPVKSSEENRSINWMMIDEEKNPIGITKRKNRSSPLDATSVKSKFTPSNLHDDTTAGVKFNSITEADLLIQKTKRTSGVRESRINNRPIDVASSITDQNGFPRRLPMPNIDATKSAEFGDENLTNRENVSSVFHEDVDKTRRSLLGFDDEKGKLTLKDFDGPSISQDVESLTDDGSRGSEHIRVKRDLGVSDSLDEIRDEKDFNREIFIRRKRLDDETGFRIAQPKVRSSIGEGKIEADNSEEKLISRKKRHSSQLELARVSRGDKKKSHHKSRKHKHRRKRPKGHRKDKKMAKYTKDNGKRNDVDKLSETRAKLTNKPREISAVVADELQVESRVEKRDLGDARSEIEVKKKREISKGDELASKRNETLLPLTEETKDRGAIDERNDDPVSKSDDDLLRVKRHETGGGSVEGVKTSNREFFCRPGRRADDLKYYDGIHETKRVGRGKKTRRERAAKSVNEIKDLMGKLIGKVDELDSYVRTKGESDDEQRVKIKRKKKREEGEGEVPSSLTRCVDADLQNITKSEDPKGFVDKTDRDFKSKLETERSGKRADNGGTNEVASQERKRSAGTTKRNGDSDKTRKKRKPHRKWDRWTDWSSCSVTCGKGRQIRWRHCVHDCTLAETEMEEKTCQLPACGPGKFLGIF